MSQEKALNEILTDLERVSNTEYDDDHFTDRFYAFRAIGGKINSYISQAEQSEIKDENTYNTTIAYLKGLEDIQKCLIRVDVLPAHVRRLGEVIATLSARKARSVYAEKENKFSKISFLHTEREVDRYSQESTSSAKKQLEEDAKQQKQFISQNLEELKKQKKEKEDLLKKKQEEYDKSSNNLRNLRIKSDARKKAMEERQQKLQDLAEISRVAFVTEPKVSNVLLHISNRFKNMDNFLSFLEIDQEIQERLKKKTSTKKHSKDSEESIPELKELLTAEKPSVEEKSKKETKAEKKKLKKEEEDQKKAAKEAQKELEKQLKVEKKKLKKEEEAKKKATKEAEKELEKQSKAEKKKAKENVQLPGLEDLLTDEKTVEKKSKKETKAEKKKAKKEEEAKKKAAKEAQKAEKEKKKEEKKKAKKEEMTKRQEEKAKDKEIEDEFDRIYKGRIALQTAQNEKFKQEKRIVKKLLSDRKLKKDGTDPRSLHEFFKDKIKEKNQELIAENNQSFLIENQKDEDRLSLECNTLRDEIANIQKEIDGIDRDIQLCSSPDANSSQLELERFNQLIPESNLRAYSEQVRVLKENVQAKLHMQDSSTALENINAKLKEISELEKTLQTQKFGIPQVEITKLLSELEDLKIQLQQDTQIVKENERVQREHEEAVASEKTDFVNFWKGKLNTYWEERCKKYAVKDFLTQLPSDNDKNQRKDFIDTLNYYLDRYDPENPNTEETKTLKEQVDRGLKQFKIGVFSNTKDDYKNLHSLLLGLQNSMKEIEKGMASPDKNPLLSTLQKQLNRENIPIILEEDWKKELMAFWKDKFQSYKTKRDQKYSVKDSLSQSFFGNSSDKKKREQFQDELFVILGQYDGTPGDQMTHRLHDKINEGLKLFKAGVFSDSKDQYSNLHDLLLKLQKSIEIVEKVVQGPAGKKP